MVRKIGKQGCSAILWGFVFFCAGQAALFGAMEFWPTLRHPEYGRKLSRLYRLVMAAPRPRLTIVVLGSSRAAVGIRPDTMAAALARESASGEEPAVFNFSFMAGGPL